MTLDILKDIGSVAANQNINITYPNICSKDSELCNETS